jgi:hypothetical protein
MLSPLLTTIHIVPCNFQIKYVFFVFYIHSSSYNLWSRTFLFSHFPFQTPHAPSSLPLGNRSAEHGAGGVRVAQREPGRLRLGAETAPFRALSAQQCQGGSPSASTRKQQTQVRLLSVPLSFSLSLSLSLSLSPALVSVRRRAFRPQNLSLQQHAASASFAAPASNLTNCPSNPLPINPIKIKPQRRLGIRTARRRGQQRTLRAAAAAGGPG